MSHGFDRNPSSIEKVWGLMATKIDHEFPISQGSWRIRTSRHDHGFLECLRDESVQVRPRKSRKHAT